MSKIFVDVETKKIFIKQRLLTKASWTKQFFFSQYYFDLLFWTIDHSFKILLLFISWRYHFYSFFDKTSFREFLRDLHQINFIERFFYDCTQSINSTLSYNEISTLSIEFCFFNTILRLFFDVNNTIFIEQQISSIFLNRDQMIVIHQA